MTREEFKNEMAEQIKIGEALYERFDLLQEIEEDDGNEDQEEEFLFGSDKSYDEDECSQLGDDLYMWEKRVESILEAYWGKTNKKLVKEFEVSSPLHLWGDFKREGESAIKRDLMVMRSFLDRLKYINDKDQKKDATYKVFISHSHKDKEFAEALVELLEFIGLGKNQLVCTSVHGYGIPSGENIFDWLRNQFNNYRLFMIFIHSASYYESPVSLNEMGAAWVLREDFHSFLVKDLDFKDMRGVIDAKCVSTKVDTEEVGGHLNELKDKLVKIFNLSGVDSTRWETKKKEFLQKVNHSPSVADSNGMRAITRDELDQICD